MVYKKIVILLTILITIPLHIQSDYLTYTQAQKILQNCTSYPDGQKLYSELNQQAPFALSIGVSRSQTGACQNTNNPTFIRKALQKAMLQQPSESRVAWLQERNGYVSFACPIIHCHTCQQTTDPEQIDNQCMNNIMIDMAQQTQAESLTITTCPACGSSDIACSIKEQKEFDAEHKQAMIEQINYLGVKDQAAALQGLPTYRYSCEMTDVLTNGKLNPKKLKEQARFIKGMGNPMLFMHHYTNPESLPHMFEDADDIKTFAEYCKYITLASDHVTHVCPISQPVAFALRMAGQKNLSPFGCNIDLNTYLEHITKAHVVSYKAIKAVSPQTQVLISHQWKPMVTQHSWTDPKYYLELLVTWIAYGKFNTDCSLPKIGNKGFVALFQDKQEYFDGIALSLYPRLVFDGTQPNDPNTSGNIDPQAALEAIAKTHEAFPTKPIYIAETGCNTNDPAKKKEFIDMTLYVCKLARDMGIDIRGVYFWGHTNDKDFYYEWGKPAGSSHFGPFETLDPHDPTGSINAAGEYIKYIVTQ